MTNPLVIAPRYRLDDESVWLEGIDPTRHYWLAINGDRQYITPVPGLVVNSPQEFKQAIINFRTMQVGDRLVFDRAATTCLIYCLSIDCYAIESVIENQSGQIKQGALVWHLFDRETIESLLRTAHPDWQSSSKDIELGRKLLSSSWQSSSLT
ncbi:hypothetical protein Pse7367_3370 [Thalassoporum mexicanum PCC 7367]|uniref:hypothetical protein n=1 Tax=Thalassoporum mexicanum TaxID=3457544 RepID=UPI00029FBE5D|nr:hypothetical protein [Pseudanabaena sp. PCC 7367]AFY71607.1 hypothetical protein Pse7367_3370 [Pseudanabaena sp. PCC 7367]